MADYVDTLKAARQSIDAVFISHMHEDHVNGLSLLLAEVAVERIYLPLLDPIGRLMTLQPEPPSAAVRAYVIDGARGLERALGAEEGTVVEVSRGETSAPDVGDFGEVWDRFSNEGGIGIATIGEGAYRPQQPKGPILDSNAVVLGTSAPRWEFCFYIEDRALARKGAFLRALSCSPGMPREARGELLEDWLDANRAALVTSKAHRTAVRDAMKAAKIEINTASCLVYSGPVSDPCLPDPWCVRGGDAETSHGRAAGPVFLELPFGVAWLGTGDAHLVSATVKRVVSHFGESRIRSVCTFTVPHHGSSRDFSTHAASALRGANAVLSYGEPNTYGHPAPETLDCIRDAQMLERHVTQGDDRRFVERYSWSW
ncbi:MAG: hypothetical protein HGA44_01400 [Cellulomonadaceae bacterium]|nr:hypothetical protein [Cellulomonadaceae bacterium]